MCLPSHLKDLARGRQVSFPICGQSDRRASTWYTAQQGHNRYIKLSAKLYQPAARFGGITLSLSYAETYLDSFISLIADDSGSCLPTCVRLTRPSISTRSRLRRTFSLSLLPTRPDCTRHP